jgi:hypothetical protein
MKLTIKLGIFRLVWLPIKRIEIIMAIRKPAKGKETVNAKAKSRKIDERINGGTTVIINIRRGKMTRPNAPYFFEKRMLRFMSADWISLVARRTFCRLISPNFCDIGSKKGAHGATINLKPFRTIAKLIFPSLDP